MKPFNTQTLHAKIHINKKIKKPCSSYDVQSVAVNHKILFNINQCAKNVLIDQSSDHFQHALTTILPRG